MPPHLAHGRLADQHPHAGAPERLGDLLVLPEVVVVVAEHREHRNVERPAHVGEDFGLRRLAVRRQVARQHDQVGVPVERARTRARRLAPAVDRSGCRLLLRS